MKTIKNTKEYIYQINGSKFISIGYYVQTLEEINQILDKLKQEHKKAKHICFAYKIDNNQKAHGDNEPNNIGKQIFELINLNDLHNVLLVTIRYMNGTKLGSGLLSRSYFHSAELITKDLNNICQLSIVNLYKIKVKLKDVSKTIEILEKNNQIIFNKIQIDDFLEITTTLTKELENKFFNPIFIKKMYHC